MQNSCAYSVCLFDLLCFWFCILLLHFRESTGSDLSTKGGEHYLKTRNNYHNHTHYTVISAPKRTDDFTSIFYLTSTRLKRPSRSLTRDTRGPRGSDLPCRKTAKHHSVDARCGTVPRSPASPQLRVLWETKFTTWGSGT